MVNINKKLLRIADVARCYSFSFYSVLVTDLLLK